METILVACLAGIAGKCLVSALLAGTATPSKVKRYDGVYISKSYRIKHDLACRNEFDANRILAAKR